MGDQVWSHDYLNSLGFDSDEIENFWDRRYLTKRMRNQIQATTYIGKSHFSGLGKFAKKQLTTRSVVGYFSGRVLNSTTWYDANPHFTASTTWQHPVSRKTYYYHFEVTSPSRYMNAGVPTELVCNLSNRPMLANVELVAAAAKINGRYRSVLILKTLSSVEKDKELLLDYGILHDAIYYEFLRKKNLVPCKESEKKFNSFMKAQYRRWLADNTVRFKKKYVDNHLFLNDFGKQYFNNCHIGDSSFR